MALTWEEMQARQARPAFTPKTKLTWEEMQERNKEPPDPEAGFGGAKELWKQIKDVGERFGELETSLGKTGAEAAAAKERNKAAALGLGKAALGGLHSLGELAVAGAISLVKTAPFLAPGGKEFKAEFSDEMERQAVENAKARELFEKITRLNLAPQNREEELGQEVIMLLPEGITALGDTVFEKTGSAIAGAGGQALGAYLMLKPSHAAKSFSAVKKTLARDKTQSPGSADSAAKVAAAFDEAAATKPETAMAVAEHIGKADVELGTALKARVDEVQGMSPEALGTLGEKIAAARLVGKKDLSRQQKLLEGPKGAKEAQPPTGPKLLTWDEAFGGKKETPAGETPVGKPPKEAPTVEKGAGPVKEKKLELIEPKTALSVKMDWKDPVHREALRGIVGERRFKELERNAKAGVATIGELYKAASSLKLSDKMREIQLGRESEILMAGDVGVEIAPVEGGFKLSVIREGEITPLETFPTRNLAKAFADELLQKQGVKEKLKVVQGGKETPPKVPVAEGKPAQYPTLPQAKQAVERDLGPSQEGMANATEEVAKAAEKPAKEDQPKGSEDDPIIYMNLGIPVTLSNLKAAFNFAKEKVPGVAVASGKLSQYWETTLKNVAPEALGPSAKRAGAVIGSRVAEQAAREHMTHGSASNTRRTFWNMRQDAVPEFIRKFEKGEKFDDPIVQKASEAYHRWADELYTEEAKLGLKYDPVENYLYHLFENGPEAAKFFEQRYGMKWGDPKFIKERTFELYEDAIAHGLRPKYRNPEDIMLARQHAHEVSRTKIEMLRELESHGLAIRTKKGDKLPPEGFAAIPRRAPNGEKYWVHQEADNILKNLYDVESLWTKKGMTGDAFRGAMWLKNTIVPIILNLSAFHGLHVLTIDNATAMVRAANELIAGKETPAGFMSRLVKAAAYSDIVSNPKMGGRINRILKGQIPEAEWTAGDKAALQVMSEGGFAPLMSHHYQTGALRSFQNAWERALGAGQRGEAGQVAVEASKVIWHAPFALPQLIQRPMFNIWIPNLKAASYLNDVASAIKIDPTLMLDVGKRKELFRKIAKSVDNRYGEMAYDQLFWNRWMRDIGVGSTLSLGWNLGFLREYGGAGIDLATIAAGKKGGTAAEIAARGDLNRALFVTFYSTQALAYGGLMTYLLTGEQPEEPMDYAFPRTGEKNPDGTDQRLNTMFYPREFVAVAKHMEAAGVVEGLSETVINKASPSLAMIKAWATGLDSMDREIFNPDGNVYQRVQQSLLFSLGELEPISINSIRAQAGEKSGLTIGLALAGFSPAAKYITSTATENKIKHTFIKYYGAKRTPYERAEYSEDRSRLKGLYLRGDMGEYGRRLVEMEREYELSPGDMQRMMKSIENNEDPLLKMFARIHWQKQKKLLDEMTPGEREKFVPVSSKEHLRDNYVPPRRKK